MQTLTGQDKGCAKEARRFERYSVEVPARVELLRSKRKNKVLFLKTLNLSATGAFFPDLKSIPVGTIMKVEYYLSFENPNAVESAHEMVVTTVTGEVVRSDRSGTAVRFAEDYQMSTGQCLLSEVNNQNITLTSEIESES